MRVRHAVPDDADAIERIRTDTWRDAYRGLMPDSLLDGMGYDATRRRALMAAQPPQQFALVAEDAGRVVGFCIGGRSRPPDERFQGEVYAIYVLPQHHRRGIGRALLEAGAKELVDRGFRSMIIWVLRENAPSRRFYERMGGLHVRDEVRELEGLRITESGYGWEDISKSLGGSSGSVQRHSHRRGTVVRAIRNFTESEIPLRRRIVVASRNLWLRVALRQACCGHDGEPGC